MALDSSNINFWKNYNMSTYYIFTLVYAHVVCKKSNLELSEKIKSIASDPPLLNKLYECCNEPKKIDSLLGIKPS